MNCWVILYTHRHGADAWPVFQDDRPTKAEVINGLDDWEPDKGETIEIRGPHRLPSRRIQQMGGTHLDQLTNEQSYSMGWDSHEGSLLKILGIQDLECQGIDQIVGNLVKWCPGFKEWRRRFKQGSMEQRQAMEAGRKRKKKQ